MTTTPAPKPVPEAPAPITTAPAKPANYIGIFDNYAVQNAIDKTLSRLAPGQSGLCVHWDGAEGINVSIVQRIGDHVSVEAAAVLPGKITDLSTFKLENLKVEAVIAATW